MGALEGGFREGRQGGEAGGRVGWGGGRWGNLGGGEGTGPPYLPLPLRTTNTTQQE